MKIKEIKAKSIITKSRLSCDYVINPYVGCMHGCIYCYARFMKRFTNHPERWGSFVDVKVNAPDLIKSTDKYKNKSIYLSSVTDPYLPLERKYKLTKRILKKLVPLQPELTVQSKSDLIARDIDLFKKFNKILIGLSFSTMDDSIRKHVEPLASSPEKRILALKKIKEAGIKTFVFISPIFPEITNWKKIVRRTKKFADEFWFESLNFYPSIRGNVFKFLKNYRPELVEKYRKIYSKSSSYWSYMEKQIKKFCKNEGVECKVYFHKN